MKRRSGNNEPELKQKSATSSSSSGHGFLNLLKLRKKKNVDIDATKEEIEFLGNGAPTDEKEIKEINNTILDSLSIKELKQFPTINNSSFNSNERNRLRFKYKNGLMRIQDTNGIIYNPEVCYFF
jgi:hypothetical protein